MQEPVKLQRIVDGANMRRFYEVHMQPTLFGEVSVTRYWGRIGHTGRAKVQTFAQEGEAVMAFTKLAEAKRRRGYRERGANMEWGSTLDADNLV